MEGHQGAVPHSLFGRWRSKESSARSGSSGPAPRPRARSDLRSVLGDFVGLTQRPIGKVDTVFAMTSGDCRAVCGVSIGPALRTFKRMRRYFSSMVHARAKLRMAALCEV